MADPTYKLSFPCPECAGLLTMHNPVASGPCPLCQCEITVELTVSKSEHDTTSGENRPKLGWDRRSFRRCSPSEKPDWKEQQLQS